MKETNENEISIIKIIKVENNYNLPLVRSQTTPIEDYIEIAEGEEDILNTYNYYCYYHSQKPFNPRLKKPKYKPTPDYEFIRSGLPDCSVKNNDSSNVSFSKDSKEKSEDFSQIIDNLNLKEKNSNQRNSDKENTINFSQVPSTYLNKEFIESPKDSSNHFNNLNNNYNFNSSNRFTTNNPFTNQIYNNNNNNFFFNPTIGNVNPMTQINKDNNLQQTINFQHKFLQNNNLYVPVQSPYCQNYNPLVMNGPFYNPPSGSNLKFINPAEKAIEYISNFSEILENLVKTCKTFLGSKFVQEIYPNLQERDKNQIIEKILPFIYELSDDQYGNYVIQKIIEYSNFEIRLLMYKKIEGKIYSLSIDMYGCRVIQKLIDSFDFSTIKQMLEEIRNDLKECILNKNGNHVIQKFVQKLPKGEYTEIARVIVENSFEVGISQFGCRVIQRIIEYGNEEDKDLIYDSLSGRFLELIFDQYGNYVIQHFVEKRGSALSKEIYSSIRGRVYEMCIHKYASNVIEKCLKFGCPIQVMEIINEVYLGDDNDKLLALVNDKFGNYCVQKMIEYSSKNVQILIIRKIALLDLKSGDGYSKHIIDFIEKKGYPKPGSIEFQKHFK